MDQSGKPFHKTSKSRSFQFMTDSKVFINSWNKTNRQKQKINSKQFGQFCENFFFCLHFNPLLYKCKFVLPRVTKQCEHKLSKMKFSSFYFFENKLFNTYIAILPYIAGPFHATGHQHELGSLFQQLSNKYKTNTNICKRKLHFDRNLIK